MGPPSDVIGPALLDNSAWAHLINPALPTDRSQDIAIAADAGHLVVCLPFLLESGYSARNAREHGQVLADLLEFPSVHIDGEVERRAMIAQQRLAQVGHHRLSPTDILIAAIAHRHELGILHYDADFDVLAERADLRFESVWLAPRGSL